MAAIIWSAVTSSPPPAVSRKTGYVLAGGDAGTKLDKARTFGIRIITEDEFLAMLRGE